MMLCQSSDTSAAVCYGKIELDTTRPQAVDVPKGFSSEALTLMTTDVVETAMETRLGKLCELLKRLSREKRQCVIQQRLSREQRKALEGWMLAKACRTATAARSSCGSVPPTSTDAQAADVAPGKRVQGTKRLRARDCTGCSPSLADGEPPRRACQGLLEPCLPSKASAGEPEDVEERPNKRKQLPAAPSSRAGVTHWDDKIGQRWYVVSCTIQNLRIRCGAVREDERCATLLCELLQRLIDEAVQTEAADAAAALVRRLQQTSAAGWSLPECPDAVLFFSINVAARPWLGHQLRTPWLRDANAALAARDRLQAARGPTAPGRRSDLQDVAALESTWRQLAAVYAQVCQEASGGDAAALVLEQLWSLWELHKVTLIRRWARKESRLCARAAAEKERRRLELARLEARRHAALKAEAKVERMIDRLLRGKGWKKAPQGPPAAPHQKRQKKEMMNAARQQPHCI
eukprot:TRINITY_DN41819_c0_g1_i1.p1 TRINITY_DN41819_c0_g1~~TRINITY_DN41819_c0_g1_i1.p1  ORF type:complete len:462 (+),score=88.81 TRINITY_DN41819_c0_g1_i1:331-1716(+)